MTIDNAPSQEFLTALSQAIAVARSSPDRGVAFATEIVPIYAQRKPTIQQAVAGGVTSRPESRCDECVTCSPDARASYLLGLWADYWPGYEPSEHGMIWLYEEGIRTAAAAKNMSLYDQTLATLLHEIEHALQRDHVLEALNARGQVVKSGG